MAQRSSIDRLPPEVRDQVNAAIHRGDTVDEIVGMLLDAHQAGRIDEPRSRSAVGRYSQKYRELAERQRDLQSVAKGFGEEFGQAEDRQGRFLVQLVTSIATRAAIPLAESEEPDIDGQELHFYARAAKDILSAAKIDTDREAKIREDAAKQAKREAAEQAATAMKTAGASEDSIRTVRARILGIAT